MNHLINISLSFLQKNIIISDANLKILKYGLNILYSTFLGILGVILCGIILKSSIYSFLFLLFYCIIIYMIVRDTWKKRIIKINEKK